MAVKPVRMQAKQVAAYINGQPTRRVQSFDWSSNFTVDSVFELGNAGLVEDSVTLVESGITVNSNEWGTTDLEAMIFGIHESRNILGNGAVSGVDNTIATIYVSSSGAGGDWAVKGNATLGPGKYLQIIRTRSTATVNDAEYVKIDTVTYVPASLSNKVGLAAGFRLTAPPATGDVVSLVNAYTIDQNTVDSNPAHFILPHRLNTSATTLSHSILLPRAFVDNLTYNFDTGGASEQNYTLVGEEERLVLGTYREMTTIAGSFMSYSNVNGSLTFRVPKDSMAAIGSWYVVYAGSNLVTSTGTIKHTSAQVTIHAFVGKNLSLTSTVDLVYYYFHKAADRIGYKGLTNIDSGIGKLTKGFITIELQQATGTVEKLLRCTGINISVPLTRESIDELGETRTISKPLEGNLRNEVVLTFNRNDLREYAKLLGSQEAFDAGTLNEILMSDLKSVKDITIITKFYNSQTIHDSTTLLKTMTFTSCNFIGDNSTTPISGASGLELTFSTESINFVGSGNPPIFS